MEGRKVCVIIMSWAMAVSSTTLPDIINMPANSWLSVPNTKLESSPEAAPNYLSASDFAKIIKGGFRFITIAWSGGAFDTKRNRLVIWGGGDNDYWGNELYGFDVNTLVWHRVTDPSLNVGNCQQANPDGTPNGRHTYGGLSYIAHADRFFACGGAWNCTDRGCGASNTWTFDFGSNRWSLQNPTSGTYPATGCGNMSGYDPATKKVYFGTSGSSGGLYSFDYEANRWTRLAETDLYNGAMAVDSKRGLVVALSYDQVFVFDIKKQPVTAEKWGSNPLGGNGQGLDYDPVADRMVAWNGGPAIYALNTDTRNWTAYNTSGAPVRPQEDWGVYGRWRYVPGVNAFIAMVGTRSDIYFYKLTSGGGTAVARFRAPPNPSVTNGHVSFKGASSKLYIYDIRGRSIVVHGQPVERLAKCVYIEKSAGGYMSIKRRFSEGSLNE